MLTFEETNKDRIRVDINDHYSGDLMIYKDGYRLDPTGGSSLNADTLRQIADKLDELNK